MITWNNSTGKPLADTAWLDNHHRAKLNERRAFAKRLAALGPKSVVDLGCATGLWLELLNDELPNECHFYGIDSDNSSLQLAEQRSRNWQRKVSLLKLDLENEAHKIPSCDLVLAFNIFPYITDLSRLINALANQSPRGTLAIRQYDGASIRFGPMPTSERQEIEVALRVATESSQKFRHYDLDRTFSVISESTYDNCSYEFELFSRCSPFPDEFKPYYAETLNWTHELLSDSAARKLSLWLEADQAALSRYFYEVDLVAILS